MKHIIILTRMLYNKNKNSFFLKSILTSTSLICYDGNVSLVIWAWVIQYIYIYFTYFIFKYSFFFIINEENLIFFMNIQMPDFAIYISKVIKYVRSAMHLVLLTKFSQRSTCLVSKNINIHMPFLSAILDFETIDPLWYEP